MAKILSLLRRVDGDEPAVFRVGHPVEEGSAPVDEILFRKHAEELTLGVFRGTCYVIKYQDSEHRTIIPAESIIDLYVDGTKPKKEDETVPPLPEE